MSTWIALKEEIMATRPNRNPRNWRSEGRKVLDELTAIRRKLESSFRDEHGYYAHSVGLLIVDFYRAVTPLHNQPLDGCFKPIRHEIRTLAEEFGLHSADFVRTALTKLRADEKIKKCSPASARDSLSTGGYATQDFGGQLETVPANLPRPLSHDADGAEDTEVARTDVAGVGE